MAGKRTSRSTQKRISLKRPGSKGASNTWKSRSLPAKEPRKITLPRIPMGKVASRLLIAFSIIILVGSISFGLIYSYRYFTVTPYFQINSIEIEGNRRLSSKNILDLIETYEGMNTFSLSIAKIERKLQQNPWVQGVSVTRIIPGTLVIKLQEKTPAYWILDNQTLWYTDEIGVKIAPVEAGQFSSLPTLVIEKGASKFADSLPELIQSIHESHLPVDTTAITHIWLSASRGLEFFVSNANIKISIGLEEWMHNLQRARETMDDLQKRGELSQVRFIKAQGHNVWVETAKPL